MKIDLLYSQVVCGSKTLDKDNQISLLIDGIVTHLFLNSFLEKRSCLYKRSVNTFFECPGGNIRHFDEPSVEWYAVVKSMMTGENLKYSGWIYSTH